MRISTIDHVNGTKLLAKLAYDKKLVPIFGSGFTKGCQAYLHPVPDGPQTIQIMKDMILKNTSELRNVDLEDCKFDEMSKYFIDYVPNDIKIEFFRNYFTNVTVDGFRKEFLSVIDWPYAYTLNVDDGIERTNCFNKVLPYKDLNRPRKSAKLLYKLHGDAITEFNYVNQENIIFSSQQYLKSITDDRNSDFLRNLISDFTQKNIVYIGCSLVNEIDLKYVYSRVEDKSYSNYRMIIRTDVPSIREETELRLYGINQIILVQDFELFYRDFLIEYRKLISETALDDYKFKDPKVIDFIEKNETIKLISGISIFDENKNEFHKGGMHILRNCVKEVEDKLQECYCVVIKGRRFGGKSFVLCSLCDRLKKYEVYFFPSTTTADEAMVDRFITEKKNSLFVFDSNSLSSSVYLLVANSLERLISNNNRVIIAVNSNDNFITNTLNSGFIEIQNNFKNNELIQNKISANKYGLVYRGYKHTNLDYLYVISKEQKIEIESIINVPKKLRGNEQVMLLLLCAMDKIFFSDLIALGISSIEIKEFCERFKYIVEQVPTEKTEAEMHSTTKIVHNSKMALLNILESFSHDEIIRCIVTIVKKFSKDYYRKRIYIELILFDTLNQLFGGKKGAGHLIFNVYDALEDYLNDSLHYWLQRSKSIYRILPSDEKQLKNAYSYAKKCYINGYNGLKSKAALTTSLICCSLANLKHDDSKEQFEEEAVKLAHEAIFSEYYQVNHNYLNSEFNNNSRNSYVMIKRVCDFVISGSTDSLLKQKAKDIIFKIDDMRDNNFKN